jgi:hypothetical protein
LAACQALMPHLLHVALSGADPDRNVPIAIWMHRGCVPFFSPDTFGTMYWPTLKPIIEALWARGCQVLFYAEGDWNAHLDSFAELPDRSIIYHVDRGDIFEVHRKLGGKFCLSGGLPNYLLAVGTPEQVRERCRKILDGVAREGGYIMDASAIMQNAARVENVRAMTEFTREHGVYGSATGAATAAYLEADTAPLPGVRETRKAPGVCVPWEEKRDELPPDIADPELVRRVWEDVDALAYTYIWHVLLSF